jgi:hypothetical protein
MAREHCGWCGDEVPGDGGLRLVEPEGVRRAAFCSLGHLRRWSESWEPWTTGSPLAFGDRGDGLGSCATCGDPLGEERLLLVRHRGALRFADAFCGAEHLRSWASSGGRLSA